MDWDTGFLADPKFLHLRDLLADPIRFGYAGFCYLRLAADAWRTCDREPIGSVVRGIESWATDALREAGLLDEELRIPEASYETWTGSAIKARQATADRQKSHRESRDVTVTHGDSPEVTRSHNSARTGRTVYVEPVGQIDPVEQDELAPLIAFLAQHGAFVRPDSPLGVRLVQLVDRRGIDHVLSEAEDMANGADRLSDRQWVLGLENRLEAIPTAQDARVLDLEDESKKRSEKIAAQVQARRMESWRNGVWHDEWGERPTAG